MKPTTSENLSGSSAPWPKPGDSTVYDCAQLELPRIENPAGNLTVMQPSLNCPIQIARVYYLYDIPGGASRGGHAHRQLHQLIIAASGSFDVLIDDGRNRRTVMLNRPYHALHIVPGIWRELHNFSSGAICLVLASAVYDEADYIRQYTEFLEFKGVSIADSEAAP